MSFSKKEAVHLLPFWYWNGLTWISENLIYAYFAGAVIGAMIVDFAYSIHLATKLKDYKELASLRFEDFKKELKNRLKNIRQNINNENST